MMLVKLGHYVKIALIINLIPREDICVLFLLQSFKTVYITDYILLSSFHHCCLQLHELLISALFFYEAHFQIKTLSPLKSLILK